MGGAASDALFNLKRLFDYDKVDSTCRVSGCSIEQVGELVCERVCGFAARL